MPQQYRKKLEPIDRLYGNLESLVVGPWRECSKDMHSLVKTLAETKVANQARSRGREASDNKLGVRDSTEPKYQ